MAFPLKFAPLERICLRPAGRPQGGGCHIAFARKLIPTPITPYYSPLISRVEMGLQRSTARRQSGGLCIVNGGWVRGWEIPVRAGPRKPPAGNPDAPGRFASRF